MSVRTMALCLAGAALAATAATAGDLQINNVTGKNVHQLFLSPVSRNNWGPDQIAVNHNKIIGARSSYLLSGIADGTYDIKLVLEDGSVCVARKIDFEGNTEWTIDSRLMENC